MTSPRAELVADTAIALLAAAGMRGLTHRAVDRAAGLPAGSTSNLARTRAALLELALRRLTEVERRRFAGSAALLGGDLRGPGRGALTDALTALVDAQLRDHRASVLARYELALEATRRPELRAIYDELGRGFRGVAADLMRRAGSPDPGRHGPRLVAFVEGLLFDAVAGAGPEPGAADLRAAVAEYLDGVLPRAAPEPDTGQDTGQDAAPAGQDAAPAGQDAAPAGRAAGRGGRQNG
ncbi:TetR/AcrR family transcriptional regulator [Actinomadura nitritigenes]|uniref:TetR/AcrR family transcriptional regulator n=1 Tax=Actinomadura nitritigenes TaxID=134602 RepID=A0ABS3R470_9ACTN|nr:TetR family transcriptional regulator C-terminal domain-containing protein [Actinomadura nitritigenes]MBO2440822.1 TetR/AcrR family transcriptional regulator [Actinomadura nitritigenes]